MAFPDESAAKTQCNTPQARSHVWKVNSEARLEVFLQAQLPDVSRESLRRALARGECRADGIVRRWGFRLRDGMEIRLESSVPLALIRAEQIPVRVLYEDDELLAIDKPAGMLSHPTTVERTGTVVNALRGMGYREAHLLHRLDRGTSGVLLAAKRTAIRRPLARMFETRSVAKRYLAEVADPVDWESREVSLPIGRDPDRQPYWNVAADGAEAETRIRVLDRYGGRVLLEAEPVSGRTNQIRIHCAAIGHPILGDTLYGGMPMARLHLHAWRLAIPLADGEIREIESPIPREFLPFTPDE